VRIVRGGVTVQIIQTIKETTTWKTSKNKIPSSNQKEQQK
jgi:hypothetical protein